MDWRVEVTKKAERDLTWLPRSERESIRRLVDRLANGFETAELQKLPGGSPRWWLRSNDQRVVLRLDYKSREIVVVRILTLDAPTPSMGVGSLPLRRGPGAR